MIDLEESLSRPTDTDIAALQNLSGDILILGAGGKMGPSLARLCCRAATDDRRIIAASRRAIDVPGVESIACDLLDRAAPTFSTSPAASSDPQVVPNSPGR
jgi:dTDP-4-dehydrorhamnose reductase